MIGRRPNLIHDHCTAPCLGTLNGLVLIRLTLTARLGDENCPSVPSQPSGNFPNIYQRHARYSLSPPQAFGCTMKHFPQESVDTRPSSGGLHSSWQSACPSLIPYLAEGSLCSSKIRVVQFSFVPDIHHSRPVYSVI